jgi:hypothetical protein
MPTTLHPTAGFIADLAGGSRPGSLSAAGRGLLRSLARQVRELAADPRYGKRRELWYRHNALEPTRAMLLVFPEDSWVEVLPPAALSLEDPFWRQWEWYLRHLAWRHANLGDDFVIEPELPVSAVIRRTGWGVEPRYSRLHEKGSYVWEAPLRDHADLGALKQPVATVDVAATRSATDALGEAVGDLLPVRTCCPVPAANLIGEATMLRGLERTLLDFHDEPAFVHRLMAFVAEGVLAELDSLEAGGHLTLNNRGHYTDSGGVGWTRELPRAPATEAAARVRCADLWGHGVAQELSGVSPLHHEEFVLEHQLPILQRFGLVAYGCCEPYDRKFGMLKRRIPRLRRVSVSPWCEVGIAAGELGDRYLLSWKPNPALIADGFDAQVIRTYLRSSLERTRGCRVEVILKDTFTVQGDARRFVEWTRIAREEIDRAAGR